MSIHSQYLLSNRESNRLIINEREFFDQSEILLNTYLKDSQAHIEKYEEEISNAEKQLHDDWNAAYDSDAENLKKWQ